MSNTANDRISAAEYRERHQSEEHIHRAVVEWADRQAQQELAWEDLKDFATLVWADPPRQMKTATCTIVTEGSTLPR